VHGGWSAALNLFLVSAGSFIHLLRKIFHAARLAADQLSAGIQRFVSLALCPVA
jgi:hypothetical protein